MSASNQDKPKTRRTSEVLQDIIDREGEEKISVGEFTHLLGHRAFALVILIFSLPNSLPVPGIPGFSTITGIPIIFIALQMMMGRDYIWLPKKISEKHFSQRALKKVLSKTIPSLRRLERLLRPRLVWAANGYVERPIGLLFLVLALIISLPIPGGNFLPGLAMSLIALGMLERDGLFVICAVSFALVSILFMLEIIMLFFKTMVVGFNKLF